MNQFILFLFLSIAINAHADELAHVSFMTLANNADWSCMQLVTSACPTPNPPYVGVWFRYWEPNLFIETVKAPGDYIINETGMIISQSARTVANKEVNFFTDNKDVEVTSTSTSNALGLNEVQFNEVHLIDFPYKMFIEGALCPSSGNGSLGIRFLSEADCIQWREGKLEPSFSMSVGLWGRLYPRIGFNTHFSSLVSSALTGLRAVSIAGDPIGLHVVTSKLDFMPDVMRDKIQMIYPNKSACMPLGQNLSTLNNLHSQDGRYVWIYWRYRECCRSASG